MNIYECTLKVPTGATMVKDKAVTTYVIVTCLQAGETAKDVRVKLKAFLLKSKIVKINRILSFD